MKNKSYKFDISIIMPIYNVEKYLDEAIGSVVKQTMNLDRIQLLLIDDGSSDGSSDVCKKYAEKYPNSIFYHRKKNGGVSSARNLGLELATGKYLLFLDGDDYISSNTCKNLFEFFEKNYDKFDLVTVRVINTSTGTSFKKYTEHFTSKKSIYDVDKDITAIQNGINVMVKNGLGLKFDENLKYGEDEKFMTEVIVNKRRIGYTPNAVYYYRDVREGSSSLVSKIKYDVLYEYYKNLLYMVKKYKDDLYVHKITIFNLIWRLSTNELFVFDNDKNKIIFDMISSILSYIDDAVILKYMDSRSFYNNIIFKIKYKSDNIDDNINDVISDNLSSCFDVRINSIDKNKDGLNMRFYINTLLEKNVSKAIKCTHGKLEFDKVSKKIANIHYNTYFCKLNVNSDFKELYFYINVNNKRMLGQLYNNVNLDVYFIFRGRTYKMFKSKIKKINTLKYLARKGYKLLSLFKSFENIFIRFLNLFNLNRKVIMYYSGNDILLYNLNGINYKTIKRNSFNHKLLFLCNTFIFIKDVDKAIYFPYSKNRNLFKDIYKHKVVLISDEFNYIDNSINYYLCKNKNIECKNLFINNKKEMLDIIEKYND